MSNGKGSQRRKQLVPDHVVRENWERTFGREAGTTGNKKQYKVTYDVKRRD